MKTIAQQRKVTKFPLIINDDNNNRIYSETSDGYWYKQEFNSNNNIIYSENSAGYWYKREFDSNNNEIYYESSYGTIEDKRPKSPCEG